MFNSKECRLCKRPIEDFKSCFVMKDYDPELEKIYGYIICYECRDWAIENEVLVDPKLHNIFNPTLMDEEKESKPVEAIDYDDL